MIRKIFVIPGFLYPQTQISSSEHLQFAEPDLEFEALRVEFQKSLRESPIENGVLDIEFKIVSQSQFGFVSMEEWSKKLFELEGAELQSDSALWLGYSMGGRLLCHLTAYTKKRNPLVKLAPQVFVSVNPGLPVAERASRRQADQTWSKKFAELPRPEVLRLWNQQSLFGKTSTLQKEFVPHQTDGVREYLPAELAWIQWCLSEWSLGNQQDFRSEIAKWTQPFLWVTGQEDTKFSELAASLTLAQTNQAQKVYVPGAFHRVHADQPKLLAEALRKFLALNWPDYRSNLFKV